MSDAIWLAIIAGIVTLAGAIIAKQSGVLKKRNGRLPSEKLTDDNYAQLAKIWREENDRLTNFWKAENERLLAEISRLHTVMTELREIISKLADGDAGDTTVVLPEIPSPKV